MAKEYSPAVDSSLGLVFRLNGLWAEADRYSIGGLYNGWNNSLNALWRNLMYRNPMEYSGEGKDIKIDLSEQDKRGWIILDRNVNISKKNYTIASKRRDKKARHYLGRWYKCLEMKDLFLRKKMFQLGLYLKESSRDTSEATFGGFGK